MTNSTALKAIWSNIKRYFNYFLWLYTLSIFIFGLIYMLFWAKSPDSFIVDRELNLNPLQQDSITYSHPDDIDLVKFTFLSGGLKQTIDSLYRVLHFDQLRKDSLIISRDLLDRANDSARSENMDRHLAQQLNSSNLSSLDSEYTQRINSLEKLKRRTSGLDSMNYVISIANVNLEKSQNAVKLAELESQTLKYQLENWSLFSDSHLKNRIDSLSMFMDSLDHRSYRIKEDLFTLESELKDQRYSFASKRYGKLGMIDFIYFSASNASTVTYGEIIPNSNDVRLVILIQVLVSLVTFSGYLSKLFKK